MKADFSKGKIWKLILAQSMPLILAQLVQLLYNIIDRAYIGHMSGVGEEALAGLGITFPIVTLISAFTNLFSTGGAPLFSVSRGSGNEKKALKTLNQVFMLLTVTSFILLFIFYIFKTPILYAFGASDKSIIYANEYLDIYLLGITFSMLSTGLNTFINAQGYPKTGMLTICIGAVLNIILDPVFIFVLNMGVMGAAIATVISQFISFIWVMYFFIKGKSMYRFSITLMKPDFPLIGRISSLGMAGFAMMATNCGVQITCNKMLKIYGGDLYVSIMTAFNSIRDVLSLPASGVGSGAQPILSYNYGAKKFDRVKQSIRFVSIIGMSYMAIAWISVLIFPRHAMMLFTNDAEIISSGADAIKIYFLGFFFMALMFSGQSTFTSLGCPLRATFFSLLRKVIVVIPLTIILPSFFGINGVFLAEPISNVLVGTLSYTTMWFTLYRKM